MNPREWLKELPGKIEAMRPENRLPYLRGKLERLPEVSELEPERLERFQISAKQKLDMVEKLLKSPNYNWSTATDLLNDASAAMRNAVLQASIDRDGKRQAGTHKPKAPEGINDWIERQLRLEPSAKAAELYARAPVWIRDWITTKRPFRARVATVRKKLQTDASK